MPFKTAILYGSVRTQRRGIRVARFFEQQLRERDHTVTLIDPLEYPLPFLDKMYREYEHGDAPPVMESLARIFREADAFLVVCGEYNHGVPPVLLNCIDHFMEEFFRRPAGIVCYSKGPFGGVRAAVHLRAVLGEVGLITIPAMFAVPTIEAGFDESGNTRDESYLKRCSRFCAELEWYADALRNQRNAGGVPYS